MPSRLKRMVVASLLFSMLTMVLTGCWDSKKIEEQFILTSVAIDALDNPGQVSVTAQVANVKRGEFGSGHGDEAIVMKTAGDSLMTCLAEMDRDSNHKLLFHHNQIRFFGIELAQQGIKKHLDMIMRNQKARLEVPLAVVDGRAEEALTAKLSQAPISGVFLGGMFEDLSEMSMKYRVRLIDFIRRLLDAAAAPVIPIIRVTGKDDNDKQEVKLAGMAVFHDDRMIGHLTNDETMGYIWSFGSVKKSNVEVSDGPNRAVLHIAKLDCKRKVTLRQDGSMWVSLTINLV